jgi:hypothetical protein
MAYCTSAWPKPPEVAKKQQKIEIKNEVAKGQYMIVEDEEIDAVQIESTRTIDIDQFVPKDEIDDRTLNLPQRGGQVLGPDLIIHGGLRRCVAHNG